MLEKIQENYPADKWAMNVNIWFCILAQKNHLKASSNVPFFPYHVDNCSTLDLEPASSSDRVLA